jgi:hypothetical protein
MGMGQVELHGEGYLGRTVDGDAVYVHIELRREDHPATTVEHEEITDPLTLAITGHTFDKGSNRWDYDGGGQITDTLTRMDPRKLADGWTAQDVTALHALWERCHLNTMRAGCAHQEVVYEDDGYGGQRPSLDLTPPCAETGYQYGRAWLTEPLPEDVVEQARRFVGMLDGTTGLRQR